MRLSTGQTVTLALGVLAATFLVGAWLFLRALVQAPASAVRESGSAIAEIAASFRRGSVETRFSSYAAEITGSQHLQFATLRELERFERIDSASILWGRLPLPDVVVRATAPVTYTYYVDLEGPWSFRFENGIVDVEAPPIAFNEPAVDASAIEFEVVQGSLLRDSEESRAALQRSLSPMVRRRALDNVGLVRDTARRRIEDFVRAWLLLESDAAETVRIRVRFVGETPRLVPAESRTRPPTGEMAEAPSA